MLDVCVHIHHIMIKIHLVFFLIPQAVLRFLSEWRSSAQAPPTIVDWQGRLTLDPPWMSLRAIRHCVHSYAGEDKMSMIKRLRRFVVGCNNEQSSRHLLPISESLKTQSISFAFILKGMRRSAICLNASMFVRIICDPASSTEEVSKSFFY